VIDDLRFGTKTFKRRIRPTKIDFIRLLKTYFRVKFGFAHHKVTKTTSFIHVNVLNIMFIVSPTA